MKIRRFIEENFLIDSPMGKFVRFVFTPLQSKIYDELVQSFGEASSFDGARRMYLKPRRVQSTSIWLGIFAALDLMSKDPIRSLEISYKDDATLTHFRRYSNFCRSTFQQDTAKWTSELDRKIFASITEGHEVVLAHNRASFYVGTASVRTGERGGTVQKILFSESAHYPDTGVLSASEIIDGTSQMVAVGHGIIVDETTAHGFNHHKRRWDAAKRGESIYKPIFFGWPEFYTPEQFDEIKRGFTDKSLIPQEYPETELEAFIASGNCAFDKSKLAAMYARCSDPLWTGDLFDDGKLVTFKDDKQGFLKIWKKPRSDRQYLVVADPCQGTVDGDFGVIHVLDRSSWEQVAVYRNRIDPGEFGDRLCELGYFYNTASILYEINNNGWATRERVKSRMYPHVVGSKELWHGVDEKVADVSGYPSNAKTKGLYVSALREGIEKDTVRLNDIGTVQELLTFIRDGDAFHAEEGCHDDCVTSLGIGVYALKSMTVDFTRGKERDKNLVYIPKKFRSAA